MGLSKSPRAPPGSIGSSSRNGEATERDIASLLGSMTLDDEIEDNKYDLASLLQEKLNLDLPRDLFVEMAENLARAHLADVRKSANSSSSSSSPVKQASSKEPTSPASLDAPTWSQESSSPEELPQLSPKVTTRRTRGPTSRSPNPAAAAAESRGRSPARSSRYPNIPRPNRSRTPVERERGTTRGRSPGPSHPGMAAGRSRSPLPRNLPKSPFGSRRRSPSPVNRTVPSSPHSTGRDIPTVASPSVFYDAHMCESSVLGGGTPTPLRAPRPPAGTPQSMGSRPPLASVAVDLNANVTSPPAGRTTHHTNDTSSSFTQQNQPSATVPSANEATTTMAEDTVRLGEGIANLNMEDIMAEDTVKLGEGIANLNMEDIKFNMGVSKPKISSPFHHGSPSNRRFRSSAKKMKSPGSGQRFQGDESTTDGGFSPLIDTPSTTGGSQWEPPSTRGRTPARHETDNGNSRGTQPVRQRSRSPFRIFSRLRSPAEGDSPADNIPGLNVNTNVPFTSPIPTFHPTPEFGSGDHHSSARTGATTTSTNNNNNNSSAAAPNQNGPTPQTPYEFSTSTEPVAGMDTADTAVNKKGRNTATPFVEDPTLQFSVNLSQKQNRQTTKTKTKAKRPAFGFRRGLSSKRSGDYHSIPASTSGSPNAPAASSTDQKTPSSTGSYMDVDGNTPPPPTQFSQPPVAAAAPAAAAAPITKPVLEIQFNIGIGGQKSPSSKFRGKRREKNPRGTAATTFQHPRSQSVSYGDSAHSLNSNGSTSSQPPSGHGRSQSLHENHDAADQRTTQYAMKKAMVMSLREEGKSHYIAKDYRSSILTYTAAIKHYMSDCMEEGSKDLLAVLLSNRAAGLLMIGACQAAADDCQKALEFISDPAVASQSNEGGPVLGPKLHNRMARALLKLGKVDAADQTYTMAMESAKVILSRLANTMTSVQAHVTMKGLEQVIQEATIGLTETKSLRESMHKLLMLTQAATQTYSGSTARAKNQEALDHANSALMTATGCDDLHEQKVSLLANLRRWREVGSHCERIAASNVRYDGCFNEDFASKHPFAGVAPAKYLNVDFFGDAREDEIAGAELKLNSKSAAEAVLRIPIPLILYYVRSLRLEERYPAAEATIRALENYIRERTGVYDPSGVRGAFAWLPRERERLTCTRLEREKGDELFRRGEFSQAAAKYALCLRIDSDGKIEQQDDINVGGRLHAVLHCNRAACLMAEKKFSEAIAECTAALRIHPRYMKALLRRARCYSRLDRLKESISEFQRWIEMVKQAKTNPQAMPISVSPCLFDGPHEVNEDDISQVKMELDEVVKAKAKADAAAKAQARYHKQRERWESESFGAQGGDAQSRRDYFYSQQSASSRRWDSFADRGPNRTSNKSSSARNASSAGEPKKSPACTPSEKNHYKVLEIRNDASDNEVKKAYRKLALKYHPDKNSDTGAVEMFRRVKQAYEVLSDVTQRRNYDNESRWRMRF